ncbi:MAG: S8 family serine peptidase [Pseudomonadota bacterium]
MPVERSLEVLLELPASPKVVAVARAIGSRTRGKSDNAKSVLSLFRDRLGTLPTTFEVIPSLIAPSRGGEDADKVFLARGRIDLSDLDRLVKRAAGKVFSNPRVSWAQSCPAGHPVASLEEVSALLKLDQLHGAPAPSSHLEPMVGDGVAIAIVDKGINVEHLGTQLPHHPPHQVRFKSKYSWTPDPCHDFPVGKAPVGHGTQCAFAALLSAPKATLLDHAMRRKREDIGDGSHIDDTLAAATQSYKHLTTLLTEISPEVRGFRSLVVNNSWAVTDPATDFPATHEGRYHDNPNHPFNKSVTALAAAGADIVFAAGNCGAECPHDGCALDVEGFDVINGANSHPQALCVGGVRKDDAVIGYSSRGPGTLTREKPDLVTYTHFLGSEAEGSGFVDTGTSTACAVAAGIVAALRSRYPYEPGNPKRSPQAIRDFLLQCARPPNAQANGWAEDYGFGILRGDCFAHADDVLGPAG